MTFLLRAAYEKGWREANPFGGGELSLPRFKISILELYMSLGPGNGQSQPGIDFNTYLDGLYGYAVVLSRNRTEAEDLVQETCLRALRSIGQLHPNGNVKSWLFTILRNIWLNEVRRWRATPGMVELDSDGSGLVEPADTAKDPHAVYVSSVEQEQVRKAIQQLPVEFREIIILREYEELSYQEIAGVLNCPLGTVMSRLARARSRLRDLLPAEVMGPAGSKDTKDNGAAKKDETAA
jgi:RNA polymerase sigma-70 factor, ECF subfamily